jgi:hypothetical protein
MPAIRKDTTPVTIESPDYLGRVAKLGDFTVAFETLRQGYGPQSRLEAVTGVRDRGSTDAALGGPVGLRGGWHGRTRGRARPRLGFRQPIAHVASVRASQVASPRSGTRSTWTWRERAGTARFRFSRLRRGGSRSARSSRASPSGVCGHSFGESGIGELTQTASASPPKPEP